jgi:hypothetical protein
VTTTPDLISRLTDRATPVRRLRSPAVRAVSWTLLALAIVLLLSILHGLRPDLEVRLHEARFLISMAAALLTAFLATVATFKVSLPDASRRWQWLPLPALILWLSTISYGCLTDWVVTTTDGVRMGEAVECFATVLMTSIPLSVAMLVMVRYAAFVHPTSVSLCAGLAVGAVTSFALALLHPLDATVMILLWQVGSAALIVTLATAFGEAALKWAAARPAFLPPDSVSTP